MRLFTLQASALDVERLWSGARRTLTDTRQSITSTRLVKLLLFMMNGSLLNDAMLEQLRRTLWQPSKVHQHTLMHTPGGQVCWKSCGYMHGVVGLGHSMTLVLVGSCEGET
jgi:hypothetical protein